MMIAKMDAKLCFGKIDLSGATTEFPDILNTKKADLKRKNVALTAVKEIVGGTSVTVKVQGSNSTTGFSDVASQTVTVADLNNGHGSVAIPETWNYEYMKVVITKTGSFTDGEILAAIDVWPMGE